MARSKDSRRAGSDSAVAWAKSTRLGNRIPRSVAWAAATLVRSASIASTARARLAYFQVSRPSPQPISITRAWSTGATASK